MSKKADLTIVLGTSMLVKPACLLPLMNCGKNKMENYVLSIYKIQNVNFYEITIDDNQAHSRIYSKIDQFFELLMEELKIDDINDKIVKIEKKQQKEKV